MMHKKTKIAILPGDGIGQDVTQAILPIFDVLKLPLEYTLGDIGWRYWVKEGNPIPQSTWDLIDESDATLLGAITSKPEKQAFEELDPSVDQTNLEYISPIIQLRKKLDLFANVRPCFSVRDENHIRLCVIRENTEGLYAGLDFDYLPEAFKTVVRKHPNWQDRVEEHLNCTLRIQSEKGLRRIFAYAFEYAQNHGYKKVSFADKPNVLRKSSAMCADIFYDIAKPYSDIQAEILNVDALGMFLVKKPESLGVIVAENMFGDILSDVAAGVMGGLGLAPSANIGQDHCYFEPVHGSGLNMKSPHPNPSAMFFSLSLLLTHIGYEEASKVVYRAVIDVIQQNKYVTPDLGGHASTQEMAQAIIDRAQNLMAKNYKKDIKDR